LKSGWKGVGGDQPENVSKRLFGVPKVMLLLAVEPEMGSRARATSQPRSGLGTDCGHAGYNPVERLPCYAQRPGRLADGGAKARQDPIT